MASRRILIVSHPLLSPKFGAAQVALNLAEALTARGHDALAWTPEPLPETTRWWRYWQAQRRAIERFAAAAGPWDLIDVPGISVSPRLARLAPVVAREVQPELHYYSDGMRTQLGSTARRAAGAVAAAPYIASSALAVLRGWSRARLIVCLGSQEERWVRRRFPAWQGKLRSYVIAPSPADREIFARVRRGRMQQAPRTPGAGTRFLWIGRWVSHKGTKGLLAFVRERAAAFPADTFTLAGCGLAAERDCPPDLLASGRLRLVPAFRREELPDLLAAHDAGLFTSTVEGWGLSLNEMLESGLPVAATTAGGVEDLRPFWGGRLLPFPPPAEIPAGEPDPTDLARYLSYFSWEEIARRYEDEILRPAAEGEACAS
jgi:glycosyltransferase involved in cell wall biosynthesis